MSQALKDHLENNPKIKSVFLNNKGEWQFHERRGYDKKVSRDEVLATEYEPDAAIANTDEIQTKTKPGKLVNKKKEKAPKVETQINP